MMKLRYLFAISMLAVGLIACSDELITIDTNFFDDESFEITYVDTLGLITSTIQFDSMPTSDTGRLLFGFSEDGTLGKIKSTSFFKVGLDSTYALDESTTSYDSLTLFLEYDGYYYYDTLLPQSYSIYNLNEALEFDETGLLYNTSYTHQSLSEYTDPIPIGNLSLTPRPIKDKGVEIRLKDQMGQDLIQLAFDGSEILSLSSEFSPYFNGFVVVPDSNNNNSIVGFSLNSQLRLYYQDKSVTPAVQKYLTFSIGIQPYFSQISYDRADTNLNELINVENDLNSTNTYNQVYIQGGVGLASKIEIPNIKKLILSEDDFLISNAQLTIRPVDNSYHSGTPLPEDIIVYVINEENEIIGNLLEPVVFIEDLALQRDTKYQADVTAFIKSQLELDEFNKNALMLTLPDSNYRGSVDRILAGDAKSDYQMELTVLYISLNED